MLPWALFPVASYLIGAIPFGYLLVRWLRGVDIRSVGSKNVGATNAARALGGWWFGVVFAFDFMKGFVPAYFLCQLAVSQFGVSRQIGLFYGMAAIVGHVWPVYLRFRGGKGVATASGAVTGVAPAAAGIGAVVFLLVFAISRFVSLGSLVAAVSLPLAYWALSGFGAPRPTFYVLLAIALLVVFKHRANLRRLLAGTEPRVSLKHKSEGAADA